ncbi:MAG: Hpt domain-containing protein [Desulfamplus sp.]|nr:Hpt domain-containing protein [Desulfamplus sp.]
MESFTAETSREPSGVVFDPQRLMYLLNNDDDLAETIINIFLDTAPQYMTSLSELIQQGDALKSSEMAHKIKGAAADLAADRIHETASAMEKAAAGGEIEKLPALMSILEERFREFKKYLASGTSQ